MATIFKHKNNIYQCISLDKKLKRLRIDKSDIEIIYKGDLSKDELEKKYLEIKNTTKVDTSEEEQITLYYFWNPKTGYSITSINSQIPEGYEQTTLGYLESYWNKNGKLR